ncbi:hypothetical protein [Sphingomonas sanguinis]|uniref:Uncharacterized protein n=1 Tax=Sphingomonas sanguinis TaxID=33051 RepID=A0A7Y7QS49_9SPHN|nr:hypothetical protein [Sphingomonas sanguinis]MBZ6380150.1 hypothetical protein [Sphingomonas sanguinis]NVP29451.1 hypothetical protein [Sphingomonas sanguinis]
MILAAVVHTPAALAFPHRADFGSTTVLSEQPIDRAAMGRVLARADRLLAASPLDRPGLSRQVVLTDGGWRWDVLSIGARSAIAFRRPFSHALVFNRSAVAADRVTNGAPLGGVRTLSGTIAHEMTHRLVADHIGEWAALRLPAWKREGYPDYVAQETSIRPGDEALIHRLNPNAPVLTYYDGRRRVAAELARNGGSVDALLRD